VAIIIAVANQKGGAGKTTTCMNLAGGLVEAGYKVLVIDSDLQASAMAWRNNGGEENQLGFEVVSMPTNTLHKDLPALAARSDYDLILVDCPPGGAHRSKSDDITRSAMLAATVILMPVQPSPVDYQAAITMLPLLQDTVLYKPDLRIWLLINRKLSGNNRLGRDARQSALEFFQADGLAIRVMETEIVSRTALAESSATGQTILSYAPKSPAADEVRQLTKEVITCLATTAAVS
jgi:chromosome partitioning protein